MELIYAILMVLCLVNIGITYEQKLDKLTKLIIYIYSYAFTFVFAYAMFVSLVL